MVRDEGERVFQRYLQVAGFEVEETTVMASALEQAMKIAGITDPNDPLGELLAKKVMQLYRLGEHDPAVLSKRAMGELIWPSGE